jgi:hypothetical protein
MWRKRNRKAVLISTGPQFSGASKPTNFLGKILGLLGLPIYKDPENLEMEGASVEIHNDRPCHSNQSSWFVPDMAIHRFFFTNSPTELLA